MTTDAKPTTGRSSGNTYLMVPILIFFALLIFAVIRGPNLISSAGIGSAVIVVAPLVLATYALTIICIAGRASVDLSIGPLIGFINVSLIQLHAFGYLESPIAVFLYAMGVGIAYQILQGLIIIFVRVQPIIVSLSGYLALVGLNLVILPRPGGVAPPWMFDWGSGTSIFSAVLVILALATAAWYILARTSFFGHLKMMGADERAAYTSGVRINFVRLGAHAIGGLFAGLAAITFTSLISSGDPTQGTTYSLMAVTALVLGGANLAGGRGGAFGSLLGALNIYLITYALSTFSFGMVQSFVTDLAYGVMLVLSLLISVALPHIQKYIRGLSPLVFFVIMSVIALGVIMHTTVDQTVAPLQAASASAIVVLEDGGVAQVSGTGGPLYSAGTYILFIIIAVVGVIYLFRTLFRHPSAPMVGLVAVIAVTALGLIFSPGDKPEGKEETVKLEETAPAGLDAYSPKFFAMETVNGAGSVSPAVVDVYRMLAIGGGIILFSSLLILVALPQVSVRSKTIAMFLFAAAAAVIAAGSLFFDGLSGDYLPSNLSGEVYAAMLVGLGLFIVTAPFVHTRLSQISHVFIVSMGVVALVAVYFGAAPVADDRASTDTIYADQVIPTKATPKPRAEMTYAGPKRVNVDSEGLMIIGKLAYCAIIVVLLHIALRIAMEGTNWRSFWRYWHVVTGAGLLWSAVFYAIGVPLWQIIAVILVAMFAAPNVMHIIMTYWIRQHRDDAISQWGG